MLKTQLCMDGHLIHRQTSRERDGLWTPPDNLLMGHVGEQVCACREVGGELGPWVQMWALERGGCVRVWENVPECGREKQEGPLAQTSEVKAFALLTPCFWKWLVRPLGFGVRVRWGRKEVVRSSGAADRGYLVSVSTTPERSREDARPLQ